MKRRPSEFFIWQNEDMTASGRFWRIGSDWEKHKKSLRLRKFWTNQPTCHNLHLHLFFVVGHTFEGGDAKTEVRELFPAAVMHLAVSRHTLLFRSAHGKLIMILINDYDHRIECISFLTTASMFLQLNWWDHFFTIPRKTIFGAVTVFVVVDVRKWAFCC